jgi:hypothetical protein
LNLNSSKQNILSTHNGILSWILVKLQVYETRLTSRVQSAVLKWMIIHISVAFQSSFSNTTSVTEACVSCRGKITVSRCYTVFHLTTVSVANYIAPIADE